MPRGAGRLVVAISHFTLFFTLLKQNLGSSYRPRSGRKSRFGKGPRNPRPESAVLSPWSTEHRLGDSRCGRLSRLFAQSC